MVNKVIEKICCPVCHGALSRKNEFFICVECGLDYPSINGRPILVEFVAKNLDGAAELVAAAKRLPPREGIKSIAGKENCYAEDFFFNKLFPQFNRRDPHSNFLWRKVSEMVEEIPTGASVLDIGAGECKYGALLSHTSYVAADLVSSSDKHDFSRLDVLADASAIPFSNDLFDAALNLVVLEHVPDPRLTVKEMARVLKPGGRAFALIPLVRPEHLAPYDFHRFTRFGIKKLFESNGFEMELIEESNGAFWTAIHYARLFAQTNPLILYGRKSIRGRILNRLWFFVLWPLVAYARYSDRLFGREFPIYFWVKAVKK